MRHQTSTTMASLVATMAAAAVAAVAGNTKAVPHILFLLADDYGWNDVGVGVLVASPVS